MRQLLFLTVVLFSWPWSTNAQTNNVENILTNYSKQHITFENSVVNKYVNRYAQLSNDFYTKAIDTETYIKRVNILHRMYDGWLVNLADKELNKLKTIYKLIQTDGETYLEKIAFKEAKEYALSEYKKNYAHLYKEVKNAKIKFQDKNFEDFANKGMALSFEQCAKSISNKEYSIKTLKLREQYADAIKTASKKDVENLLLLNKKEIIKCTEYNIEQQYSLSR